MVIAELLGVPYEETSVSRLPDPDFFDGLDLDDEEEEDEDEESEDEDAYGEPLSELEEREYWANVLYDELRNFYKR